MGCFRPRRKLFSKETTIPDVLLRLIWRERRGVSPWGFIIWLQSNLQYWTLMKPCQEVRNIFKTKWRTMLSFVTQNSLTTSYEGNRWPQGHTFGVLLDSDKCNAEKRLHEDSTWHSTHIFNTSCAQWYLKYLRR